MTMGRRFWSLALAATTAVAAGHTAAAGAVTVPDAPQAGASLPVRETTIARTLRFAGSGERTVVVRLVRGSIAVTASNDATVALEARRRVRAASAAAAADAEREVTLDIADNAVMIGAVAREPHGQVCGESNEGRRGWTWRPAYDVRFDVALKVPPGTRLALCTTTGGDIGVEGTSGEFQVTNVNGRITMTGIRGSGFAETVNGAVAVSFAEPPRAGSRFKTVNGDISVTFPPSLSAVLAMRTSRGGLFTDFDVQPVADARPITGERRGAATVYRSNPRTRVRVGAGGPEMLFDTFNGDVRILRAAR
jgi:hypothetical protein